MKFYRTMGKLFSVVTLALGLFLVMGSSAQASPLGGGATPELTFMEYTQLGQAEIEIQPFCNPVFRVTRTTEFRRTFQGSPSNLRVSAGTTLFSTGSPLSGWWPVTSPGTGAGWVHGNALTAIAC